jgi:hypothetical protein
LRITSNLPFVVLAGFVIFWSAFFALNSPNFGNTDTFIFRDAGCNVAAHLGFVSLSVPNDPASIPPVLFADYTPGTPFLFASAACMFGCTPYTDTYFDLLLLSLIAFFLVLYFPNSPEHRKQRVAAAALAGITLPVGLFQTTPDRPEPIALACFFALLLLWKIARSIWLKSVIAGLSGCLFLIHPFVGIVSYMLFLLLLACAGNTFGRLKIVLVSFAIAVLGVLAWAWVLHHSDATAIHRFIGHAFGERTGVGLALKGGAAEAGQRRMLHSYAKILARYFDNSSRLRAGSVALLLVFFLILGVAAYRSATARRSNLTVLLALFCILFLFPLVVFPGQANYFAASSALLFAMAAIGGYPFSERMRNGRVIVFLVAAGAIFSLPGLMIRVLNSTESKASFIHARAQESRVKNEFLARGLGQPRLLVDSTHYLLYKPDFPYLYNLGYFRPNDSLEAFDGLVRCYTGTLAFSRPELSWQSPFHPEDWELIDGDAYAAPISLFGHRVQRRNWSWSCDVYARRRTQP